MPNLIKTILRYYFVYVWYLLALVYLLLEIFVCSFGFLIRNLAFTTFAFVDGEYSYIAVEYIGQYEAIPCNFVYSPGACTIKLFTAVLNSAVLKASVYITASRIYPSLIFVGKARWLFVMWSFSVGSSRVDFSLALKY